MKVQFWPILGAEDFLYVDNPPRTLTIVERRVHQRYTTEADYNYVELLSRTEGPFHVRIATDAMVVIE